MSPVTAKHVSVDITKLRGKPHAMDTVISELNNRVWNKIYVHCFQPLKTKYIESTLKERVP